MATTKIGDPVRRVEDHKFITGGGRYTDDIQLPGQVYCSFVRSPHAHATVQKVDTSAAAKSPGVVAVYTGADLEAAGVGSLPCAWQVDFKTGEPMNEPPHPCLAATTVRHVGDAVAVVVAETAEQADDAAELVDVTYKELPAVVDMQQAIGSGAAQIHAEAKGNLAFIWELGDAAKTDAAVKGAAHVTTLEFANQRLIPNAIEPRAALADFDPATGRSTLYTTSQNPHTVRAVVGGVLGLAEPKLRVVAPDVGGGFGSKIFIYPEETVATWCARQLARPVRWTAARSESFLTDAHGRDHLTKAELALDADGKFLALRVHTLANMGAYLQLVSSAVPTYLYGTLLQGQYTTGAIHVEVSAVFTNTTPVDAYRGAGRPEACYVVERLVDQAAHELGIDPAELRAKNFIPPFDGVDQPGYETQVAMIYDSGNYEPALRRALEIVDYKKFRSEQESARKQGRLLGIGLSSYIEACGVAPSKIAGALGARGGFYESSIVRVQPSGQVTVMTGTHSHGQGHDTSFAQVVAAELGIPMEDVEIVHGDTDRVSMGGGTSGSRSIAVGGTAIMYGLQKVKEKGAKIAAHLMEAAPEDLDYADGGWKVRGTDRSLSFQEVAGEAYTVHNYPDGLEPGLEFTSFFDPDNFTFPFGTHIAVVEVDAETGQVRLQRFVAVDDVGNVINPLIVEGQLHGGITQGVGQALLEAASYDAGGQLLTGSYIDYAMPRADDVPSYEVDRTVTPSPVNPLGAKGAGEAGTIAATPAVVNAAIDALWHLGVRQLEMPLTPRRVWQAMQQVNGGNK